MTHKDAQESYIHTLSQKCPQWSNQTLSVKNLISQVVLYLCTMTADFKKPKKPEIKLTPVIDNDEKDYIVYTERWVYFKQLRVQSPRLACDWFDLGRIKKIKDKGELTTFGSMSQNPNKEMNRQELLNQPMRVQFAGLPHTVIISLSE